MAKKRSDAIATNRKARHDFFIEETYEAGMVLKGTEIKSIRAGRVNLKDAFARFLKVKRMFITCISHLMSKVTSSTMNQHVRENCYFIKVKSIN